MSAQLPPHGDPYSPPQLSIRIAMHVFKAVANWTYFGSMIVVITAWVGLQRCFPAFAAWDPTLDKLNFTISVVTLLLENVMLMAQKAINEFDRDLIRRIAQLTEQAEARDKVQHALLERIVKLDSEGLALDEATKTSLDALNAHLARLQLLPAEQGDGHDPLPA